MGLLPERSYSDGDAEALQGYYLSWFSMLGGDHISFLFSCEQWIGTSKVVEIDRYMLSTMVGEWKQCRLYESKTKRRMPVDLASEIFKDMISFYSEENWVGALLAGWDVHGHVLFCVDEEMGCTSGYSFAVGSGSSYAYDTLDAGSRCDMIADEAASFARWAIRRAAFQDGVANGVAAVYSVGPHGWELMSYDDAGNPGPYYPVTMNSVDQEMTEDQELTEEDNKWLSYLELVERRKASDRTLLRICKS